MIPEASSLQQPVIKVAERKISFLFNEKIRKITCLLVSLTIVPAIQKLNSYYWDYKMDSHVRNHYQRAHSNAQHVNNCTETCILYLASSQKDEYIFNTSLEDKVLLQYYYNNINILDADEKRKEFMGKNITDLIRVAKGQKGQALTLKIPDSCNICKE